jgi:ligand-binding sensor domain-containing protein
VWVGTPEGGVNLYDPDKDQFTRFGRGKGGLSAEGVTAIARDQKDRIWFAMSTGGLNRFEPTTGTFTEYVTKPLDAAITAIHADKAGNLWLGTASEGVIRWNPDDGSTMIYRSTPGDDLDLGAAPVTAILFSGGKVWIGSDGGGLFTLDPATKKLVKHRYAADDPGTISDDHVTVLFEDRKGILWIGTTNGLNRMESSGRLTRYQHDPDDPNDPTKLSFPTIE